MLQFVLQALTLVLPIFLAGIVLIFILKRNDLAFLNTPIDFGQTFHRQRLFGKNKTWRGVAVYILVSILVCWGLSALAHRNVSVVHPIFSKSPIVVGLVISISYIVGELMNSFVKRRLEIPPGNAGTSPVQTMIDNLDGMMIVAVALMAIFSVSFWSVLIALVFGAVIHVCTEKAMRLLMLK